MWLLVLRIVTPPDGAVLTLLMQLDGTMFLVFGIWAGGPRVARYIAPWAGTAVQAAGEVGRAVVERLRGTDRHREDDER
jgi:hypothetical protein